MLNKCQILVLNSHFSQSVFSLTQTLKLNIEYFWRCQTENINWRRVQILPHTQATEAKKVHFKILHKIYTTKCHIAEFTDIDHSCTFCKYNIETIAYLFFDCKIFPKFWTDLGCHFFEAAKSAYSFIFYFKGIISYCDNPDDGALEQVI